MGGKRHLRFHKGHLQTREVGIHASLPLAPAGWETPQSRVAPTHPGLLHLQLAVPRVSLDTHSSAAQVDVCTGAGDVGSAASSLQMRQKGPQRRTRTLRVWQCRRCNVQDIPPEVSRNTWLMTQATRQWLAHVGRGSVCMGLPLGLLLISLPKLIHSAPVHRIQPEMTPCSSWGSVLGREEACPWFSAARNCTSFTAGGVWASGVPMPSCGCAFQRSDQSSAPRPRMGTPAPGRGGARDHLLEKAGSRGPGQEHRPARQEPRRVLTDFKERCVHAVAN